MHQHEVNGWIAESPREAGRVNKRLSERAEPAAARVARFEIAHEGHAMLRRAKVWTKLTTAFTLDVISGGTGTELAGAWAAPEAKRLRMTV